jgi:hypothetical protein
MEMIRCQSCGMPRTDETLVGTEKDGAKNEEYCIYCYENGEFKQPELDLAGMIETFVPFMMKDLGMSESAAREHLNHYLPKLKRWKTA